VPDRLHFGEGENPIEIVVGRTEPGLRRGSILEPRPGDAFARQFTQRNLGLVPGAESMQAVDVHVPGECRPELGARPGDHVAGAARQIARRHALGEDDRAARIALRGDHDDRIAADQGRKHRGDQAQQGRLVGCHDADDAGGLGGREVEVRAGDRIASRCHGHVLIAPAGVPYRAVDRGVDLAPRGRSVDGSALHELLG
jgi:hypothetical protein